MKLKHLLAAILSVALLISGCSNLNGEGHGNNSQSTVEERFKVRWVDYDGTLLKEKENVLKGTTVHYGTPGPKREGDETHIYTFSRWEPKEGPINGDTTYTAVYDEEVKTLTARISRNETHGFYTLELDNSEPHFTFDDQSLNNAIYVYDKDIPEDYPSYSQDLIKEIKFTHNIETISYMVNSYALARVVFSQDVKSLNGSLFNAATRANPIIDVYFEGDCPTITKGTLKTNGGYGLRCYYHEGKQGFSDSYIDGQPFMVYGKTYTLPNITKEEYALRAVKESRLLAKRLETLYQQNADLMYFPFTNLAVYKEIKDFTLELTKNAHNKKEKAEMCYEWLSHNVTYDGEYTMTQLEDDWADKKAVCAGYTALLHDMLAAVEILSFYTRGIAEYQSNYNYQDVALGNNQTTENTHAWITALIDDEVVIMDATWGAYNIASFDMSDEEVANRYITLAVDFINVIPEGFSFYNYEYITLLNDDGEIYIQNNGILMGGQFSTYNYKIHVDMTTVDNPYMLRNKIFDFNDNYGEWRYCLANGREVLFLDVAYYQHIEKTYYHKTFTRDLFSEYLPSYAIEDGLLVHYYNALTASIARCFTIDETVNIPATINGRSVTTIAANAFKANLHLKKVIIPNSVKKIENDAFCECAYLEEVSLSQNLELIDGGAFSFCYRLKAIALPDSVLKLGEHAFAQCYSLETVSIGRQLKEMPYYTAFASDYSVKAFTVSSDNTTFKTYDGALFTYDLTILIAYCNGDGKQEVTLHKKVKEIGYYAMAQNKTLKTINLREGLEYIDDGAFCGSGITSLVVPSTVKLVGGQAFDICESLTSIVMNCSEYAFVYCGYQGVPFVENKDNYENGLLYAGNVLLRCVSTSAHVKIKEGTTNVAYGAFQDEVFNNGLYTKSVLLPSSLRHINIYAFANARKLEKIIMTNSVMKVYESAFEGSPLLNEVIYVGTEEEFNMITVDERYGANAMFINAKKTFVSEVPEQYR